MVATRVFIAGGSGALGRPLAASLADDGVEPVTVSRSPGRYVGPGRAVSWDDLQRELSGAAGVVNLTGESVAQRWTRRSIARMTSSRVEATRRVVVALREADRPPPVWVQASAVGIYGDRGEEELDESSPPGEGVLADICRAWEAAADVDVAGVRRVVVRIGVVLQEDAGAWPVLTRLAKLGLGGKAGDGRQFVPWISGEDMTRVFRFCLDDQRVHGVVNAVAPGVVRNAELMAHVRRRVGRSMGVPTPAWGIRVARHVLGVPDEPALASERVVPRRLEAMGFAFREPTLKES